MDDELPNDRLFGDRIMGCAKSLVGSGVKSRVSIILDEIPEDSSRISRLMCRRKASLLHLPCNMMSTTETLLMYIASAAPHLMLCGPKFDGFKFVLAVEVTRIAALIVLVMSVFLIMLCLKLLTSILSMLPCCFIRTWRT